MKRWLGTLMLATVLVAAPALAQEHEAGKASESSEKEGGMEIWKWLNFLILCGVLGYLAKKHGAPLLVTRAHEIREGLAAGEKAKADAQAKAAAIELRLAGLDKEIAGLRDSARADREHEVERIQRDTQKELARISQHAAMEIESAAKQARMDVQRHATRLAMDLAEKKVRERMSPGTQSALVESFVAGLAGGNTQ